MSWFLLQKMDHHQKPVCLRQAAAVLFALVLLLAGLPPQARSAAGAPDHQQLSEPEAWVLKQVKDGKGADLAEKFGQEEQRRQVAAGFLKKLLAGGFKDSAIPYQGVQLAHAVIIDGPLDLNSLAIKYPLTLSYCLFTEDVTLAKSHCEKDLSLAGSTFLKVADFRGIKVDGRVNLEHAVFDGACLWVDADISEKFLANGAEFRSVDHKADFRTINVATEAYFIGVKFYGPVDFELAHVGVRLNMSQAEFFHKTAPASFLALTVDKYALFNGARFHGPVSFVIAQIGIQFWADGAEFLYPEVAKAEFLDPEEPGADFRSIKTGNSIFFRKAVFQGPVRFACNPKSFSQMKVGQEVFLDNVTIDCDVDLSYGEFHDVVISGTIPAGQTVQESSMSIPRLTLNGVQVQRDLTIANARIGELLASNVHVKGPARFNNIAIRTLADFRHSSFAAMNFQKVDWPQPSLEQGKLVRKICLNELTYSSLSIDRQEDQNHRGDYQERDFDAINRFVENSPFNTQTYVQLEAFFKRIGKEDWANTVFIRMQDRDLEENLHWYDPVRWLEWLFWGRLAGYGKKPFRVFFISMTLIILGAYLFDPEYLLDNKKSTEGKFYKSWLLRFFLSVDRFLPIDLGLAKNWDAKASRFFVWFYFHLQQILGWILIPIALASIYTQIK
jgi:uncharacterized protein YjbI with pentapeptide repeats